MWRKWIAWSKKPSVRTKDLVDILYTKLVIGDFLLYFVAMETGVSRGRIVVELSDIIQ